MTETLSVSPVRRRRCPSFHRGGLQVGFLLLCLSCVMVLCQEPEGLLDPTTTTMPVTVNLPELGRVRGIRRPHVSLDFFGGIPYAAPPVGGRRWASPEPVAPWAPATFDASDFGPDCWQLVDPVLNPNAREMSEDCLTLNIFTPAGQSRHSELLPVMVWLHGGAFQMGSAARPEYDGTALAARGSVIVVTVNYRLGGLGFLVSSSDGLYGNYGLQDQRAALHWIQEHIQYFGGDPDSVTLFGESAGAVMTGLHLLMDGAGSLFHKAILQSNPLGLQFRSVVVADFLGEAFKRSVDCRDLACLRAERVEELMRAQSSLMGVPRSVGDFFTWGPTLTQELTLTFAAARLHESSAFSPPALWSREHAFRDLNSNKWQRSRRDMAGTAVNVSQPLKDFHLIPPNIPIILGSNKNEGEMFVHGAFPITMSKAVYWMFVGALFRDSASRVLKHYRSYVDQIEAEAADLARRQIDEEENRQYYLEHKDELDEEYQMLLRMNASSSDGMTATGVEALVQTWSRGGVQVNDADDESDTNDKVPVQERLKWWHFAGNGGKDTKDKNGKTKDRAEWWPFGGNGKAESIEERKNVENRSDWWPFSGNKSENKTELQRDRARQREERRRARAKERALKAAAKVVVDYRPVMSRIIGDYLFRCPTWHLAHQLSRDRRRQGFENNVYLYQWSHSTHVPGFKECWGKACHTSELPYAFDAMDIIRSNYSTLSPYAQEEAPLSPEYPYTDILAAYKDAAKAADHTEGSEHEESDVYNNALSRHSERFQKLLGHFFGDYFHEDADEEIARDMANRWVGFARTGDPNFDGNRAEWRPWRPSADRVEDTYAPHWSSDNFEQLLQQVDKDYNTTDSQKHPWSDDIRDGIHRERTLKALGYQVAEDDGSQTMLRREQTEAADNDKSLNSLFFGHAHHGKSVSEDAEQVRRAVRQLERMAQDMGIIGTGLRQEWPRRGHVSEDDFYPEMLEMKWPPEGRLVERDCTCDFWDRIRYRY